MGTVLRVLLINIKINSKVNILTTKHLCALGTRSKTRPKVIKNLLPPKNLDQTCKCEKCTNVQMCKM